MRAIVTGGFFDQTGECVVWRADFARGTAELLVRWTPPASLCVPSKGFTGACLGPDGLLYVAAHAAIARVDIASGTVTGVLHQPCFNDLHHVETIGSKICAVNSGIGSIDVFTLDGVFSGSHSFLPAWANARRLSGKSLPEPAPDWAPGWSPAPVPEWTEPAALDSYYSQCGDELPFHKRKVRDFLHLNHVAALNGNLVVTCFTDGTLRDARTFEVLARFPGHFLHDGVVDGDSFWLTTTDGGIFELDARSFGLRRRLSAFSKAHYGWCRGLDIKGDFAAVGLTEVRDSKVPRYRWADLPSTGSETAVRLLDRRTGSVLSNVFLGDVARHSNVYGILFE